jgi:hypothetical protein
MVEHDLKTWPEYFEQVWNGNKRFELRKDDRDYKVLDQMTLREYVPTLGYTGRVIESIITHVLRDVPDFGLKEGYCILSFNITNYID